MIIITNLESSYIKEVAFKIKNNTYSFSEPIGFIIKGKPLSDLKEAARIYYGIFKQ